MMSLRFNRFALLAFAALGLAAEARAIGAGINLYTPGYFLDKIEFDKGTYRYYHDYEVQVKYGIAPNITPYVVPAVTILDVEGYNSCTYTVFDAGRYVSAWNFYVHDTDLLKLQDALHPKSLTVTYSMVSELGADIDVIPLLKMMSYDLSYNANSGTWVSQPAKLENVCWSNEVSIAAASVVSRTGYTFDKWNMKSDGMGKAVDAGSLCFGGMTFGITSDMVDSAGHTNVILYAQWKANAYIVDLIATDADPGSAHTTQITVTYDQKPATITSLPTRQYWKFDGYYTMSEGGEKVFDANGEASTAWRYTDVNKLYAHWVKETYTVTFLVDGLGKVSPSGSSNYECGSKVVAVAEALEGGEFIDWSDGETSPSRNITIVSNAEYVARFSAKQYTLQFSYYDTNVEWVTVNQYYHHGDVVVPPSKSDYDNLPGYHSTHWNPAVPETAIKIGYYEMQYSGNLYVVVFDGNGSDGGMAIAKKTLTYGEKYKLPGNTYTRTGYSFLGWNVDPSAKDALFVDKEEVSDLAETGKVTLYAIWTPNHYSIKFIGGEGATGSMPDQDFTYDVAQALTANGFVREGQKFLHWSDLEGRIYENGQVVSNLTTTAGGIVTLTAVWSNYHYVRFDGNGATNETEMALQRFLGAETNALNANIYGKVGYRFEGWATNRVDATNLIVAYTNCQSASFPFAKTGETNDLYAVWTTNRYTIVFNPGNAPTDTNHYFFGAMDPLTNCAYDTAITIKCGWTNYCSQGLLGWSRTEGAMEPDYPVAGVSPKLQGADTVVSNLTTIADDAVKLYAVWADVGALSEAAGLTNAVLISSERTKQTFWQRSGSSSYDWDVGHNERVQCKSTDASGEDGKRTLKMSVYGGGILRFSWCYRHKEQITVFSVEDSGKTLKDLTAVATQKLNWDTPIEISIEGDGVHEIQWFLDGSVAAADVIAVDDIYWIPEVELVPGDEMPKFATKEEAEAAATNARVARPNKDVEGVVTADAYDAMFTVRVERVTSDLNLWTLAIDLTTPVSNAVQTAVDGAASNLVNAASRRVSGENELSVDVEMKAGLYFGIAATNEIEWITKPSVTNLVWEWVLGTGSGKQSLSVEVPSDETGFFKVVARPEPPEQ